ncbi:hypothetical protein CL633_01930 [bacterium]|nr:hypothetical protein [bacterium]
MIFDFRVIIIGIVTIINLIFGIMVLTKSKRREALAFGLFILTLVFWSFGVFMFYLSLEPKVSLFWAKFLYFAGSCVAVFFLFFSLNFPQRTTPLSKKKILLIFAPLGVFFILYFFSGAIIKGIIIKHRFIYGPLRLAFDIPFFCYFIGGFIQLFTNYKKSSGLVRLQLRYIAFSSLIALTLAAVTNVILLWFGIFEYIWIGPEASLVLIVASSYAILRHRLMDIRIALRQSLVYLIIAGFAYGAFYFCIWLFNKIFGSVYAPGALIIGIFIAIIFTIIFLLFEKFIKKIANKYFFGTLYSKHEALQQLSANLTTIIKLDKLLSVICSVIIQTLNIDKLAILLILKNKQKAKLQKIIGFPQSKINSLIKFNFLAKYLEKNHTPLVYEEIQNKTGDIFIKTKTQMQYLKANLVLPLISKNRLQGIIILGKKLSKEAYTKEDLSLLTSLANQTALAIENASLYDSVKDLNKNLEQKVQEQTKDIRAKAEDIKALLRMKSDLLDTISHQLRTPTSIFRGMLSMVNEKGDNALKPNEREKFIKDALTAADRLVVIINSIMEANELLAEKARINFKPTNIEQVIQECINIFNRMAQDKKIKLIFKKPKNKIPKIVADPNYVKSALEKLLDNAVWYSRKNGKVAILASHNKQEKTVSIKIKDNGIGLTKSDKKILFTQFGKGRGAKMINVNSSGLGLFIVKKIAKEHKGKVTAESDGKNKGSIFTLTLPVMQVV